MSGYGPQETWPEHQRVPFFLALEEEIIKAEFEGKSILIEIDANSKLGCDIIPGDNHAQSENGKILAGMIVRHGLVLGNSMDVCKGLITRKRTTKTAIEESIIDFVILSDDLRNEIESIIIDDEREHVLTRITKTKKGIVKVESDHNMIYTHLKIPWNKKVKDQRREIYNLKNETCQKAFKEATSKENNKCYLSSVFEENDDINDATEIFMKRLQKTIAKCFKKVRIKEKVDDEKEELFRIWKEMKKNVKNVKKSDLEEIENKLSEKYAEEFHNKIDQNTNGIDCQEGGFNSGNLWNLKKQIFPKCKDPPTAMLDPKTGNLLTSEEKIEEVAIEIYKQRLHNRPMNKNMKQIKDAKELLCEKLLSVAKLKKTPDWTMKDLSVVLKKLKKQKSRDPYGLANDLSDQR